MAWGARNAVFLHRPGQAPKLNNDTSQTAVHQLEWLPPTGTDARSAA
jgi:hypothetical protein